MEIPLTFAMALAWDINSIRAADLGKFFVAMAEREFGSDLSQKVGAAWREYDRLASLRRHEHIEPSTFSLLNYNEAESILARWKTLLADAEAIQRFATEEQQPSVFELIVHPIKASYIFVTLQISLGRNQLYARQRRNSANKIAQQVLELFDADFTLSEDFHTLLNGKWNRIMSQPHYGFGETWHVPYRDMISGLCYVQRRQNSNPIAGQMGVAVEGHEGVRPGQCNEESDRTHPSRRDLVPGVTLGAITRYGPESRWFDIYTRGSPSISWTASAPHAWVKLSRVEGKLVPGEVDARVEIRIDWAQVPASFDEEVLINVSSAEGDFEQIHLPILGRQVPDTFMSGFVEGDGYVSMLASSGARESHYRVLWDAGRTSAGAVTIDPSLRHASPHLTYDVYVFTETSNVELLLYFNMTLDLDPTDPMRYNILVDDHLVETHRLSAEPLEAGQLPDGWDSAVQDCAWVRKHTLPRDSFRPGKHTIRLRLSSSNLMLEMVVLNLGGVRESYLGPPPSFYLKV